MAKGNHEDPELGIVTSGATKPIWFEGISPIKFASLDSDIKVDSVIIGGGISGMTIAYCLSKEGKKIALVEDGYIGSGETGRTTAHLTYALDDRYFNLIKFHGEKKAKLSCESHKASIDFIESVVKEEKIDCDFERVNGYLFKGYNDTMEVLEKELEALKIVGCSEVNMEEKGPIEIEPGPCIVFPNQGQFHPLKYLKGLATSITKNGGKIFTQTHVAKYSEEGIETDKGNKIRAKNIIIATNAPINDSKISLKQAAYRTFAIAVRVKKNSVPKALYWDTNEKGNGSGNAYHYVRLYEKADEEFLIVGGEDHKTAQSNDAEKRFYALEKWTENRFPIQKVEYKWSGQVMESTDGAAYIGKYGKSENIYVATGDSGNGLTHGTIAGILIKDLILGNNNEWAELYYPSRSLKGAGSFLKENMNVAKEFIKGIITDSTGTLKNGEGSIITRGLSKIAIYKDEDENIHEFSAICPHMKCTVKWNSLEKSFDCPCHGSRFNSEGHVINGPASSGLEPIKAEQEKMVEEEIKN